MKKILSLVLAVAMLLAISVPAFANDRSAEYVNIKVISVTDKDGKPVPYTIVVTGIFGPSGDIAEISEKNFGKVSYVTGKDNIAEFFNLSAEDAEKLKAVIDDEVVVLVVCDIHRSDGRPLDETVNITVELDPNIVAALYLRTDSIGKWADGEGDWVFAGSKEAGPRTMTMTVSQLCPFIFIANKRAIDMGISGSDAVNISDLLDMSVTFGPNGRIRPDNTYVVWDITGADYEYIGDHVGTDSVRVLCKDSGSLHVTATLVDSLGKPVTNYDGTPVRVTKEVTVNPEAGSLINTIVTIVKKVINAVKKLFQ